MKKRLLVFLILSLVINLLLGVLLYKGNQDKQALIDELCGNITLSGVTISSRLDEAVETNNRRLALMAGNEMMQLSGLLNSYVCLEMGVQTVYGAGSLSSLAELIIWGDEARQITSIGMPEDKTPFSASEIEILEQISNSFANFALAFYSDDVTVNTYMHEERTRSNVQTINRALEKLQNATEGLF